MRVPPLRLLGPLIALLLFGARGPAHADDAPKDADALAVPTEWLVIEPLNRRSRRPFNPDAVFDRYLLDLRAGVPEEGDVLAGTTGEERTWTKVAADEKGRIGGRRIAYAYTRMEVPKACVRIARLHGGAYLYVNGTGHVGNIYGSRFDGFPVSLRKGANDLFVRGVRGSFKLTLEEAPATVYLAPWSRSQPDLVAGETVTSQAGLFVVNAGVEPALQVQVTLEGNDLLKRADVRLPHPLPPLSVVQVRLPLVSRMDKMVPADAKTIDVPLSVAAVHTPPRADGSLVLKVRKPEEALVRTLVSGVDDSVQVYGLRRPQPAEGNTRPMGLVLSLHGAGVKPRNQANAYAAKPDFWIVAPTNRRPFGFDWQDWGRTDAYEVLNDALGLTRVDRSRVYLTGHSMGGHGTWHLAANDPDGFAAIAPSAGWVSFDSYGGKRPSSPLSEFWKAADGSSDTLARLDNLVQIPTFILHGEKDDNVPVSEARTMQSVLTKAGAPPTVHFEPDKKHWWDGYPEPGAQCVDWPGIFDLFRRSQIPQAPRTLRFESADLAIDSRHHWIQIWQPLLYGKPSRVAVQWHADRRVYDLHSENVRVLRLDLPTPCKGVILDGRPYTWPSTKRLWFSRGAEEGDLRRSPQPPARMKSPYSSGPFKSAFDNGFVLVYGTRGTPAENAALLERARFDAQVWCYRANGRAPLLADTAVLAALKRGDFGDHNLILYGNSDTNAAFCLLRRRCPLTARRGRLSLGDEAWIGRDLAALFVYPRAGSERALVGVFADTGVAGTRLGYNHLVFVSGAGYPDYTIFGARVLTKEEDAGVLATGWFDRDWKLQQGGYVRSAAKAAPR